MLKLDLVEVGDSLGLILPTEVLDRLNVREGDYLVFTEDDGGYLITPEPHNDQPRHEGPRTGHSE